MSDEQVMVFKTFGVRFIHLFHFLSILSGFEVKLSFVEDSLARYKLQSGHTHTHTGWMQLSER